MTKQATFTIITHFCPHWSDIDYIYYLGDTSDSDNGDYSGSDDDAGDYDDYYSFNDDEEGRASQVPAVQELL